MNATQVHDCRTKLGLSIVDFAAAVKMAPSFMQGIEEGKINVPPWVNHKVISLMTENNNTPRKPSAVVSAATLVAFRAQHDLSISNAAAMIDVTSDAWRNWENSRNDVAMRNRIKIQHLMRNPVSTTAFVKEVKRNNITKKPAKGYNVGTNTRAVYPRGTNPLVFKPTRHCPGSNYACRIMAATDVTREDFAQHLGLSLEDFNGYLSYEVKPWPETARAAMKAVGQYVAEHDGKTMPLLSTTSPPAISPPPSTPPPSSTPPSPGFTPEQTDMIRDMTRDQWMTLLELAQMPMRPVVRVDKAAMRAVIDKVLLTRRERLLALAQEHLGLCIGISLGLAVGAVLLAVGAGLATVYFQ